MSLNSLNKIDVISNIQDETAAIKTSELFSYLPKQTIIWINNSKFLLDGEAEYGAPPEATTLPSR